MDTLQDWLTPTIIWFVLGLLLLLAEFVSSGILIIFFGIGAWVVALLCLMFDMSLNLQLTVFLVTSLAMLILLRARLKILFGISKGAEPDPEGVDATEFLGQKAVVIERITPKESGKVEFRGTNWNAEADETLAVKTPVIIIDKHNITLKVQAL